MLFLCVFLAFSMCFFTAFISAIPVHCNHVSFFSSDFFSPSCCNPFLILHISITSSVSSYLSSFIFKNLAHLFNFQAFNLFTTIRVPTHCQHFAFPDVQLWCVEACASYLSASRQSFVTGIMTTQQQATQRTLATHSLSTAGQISGGNGQPLGMVCLTTVANWQLNGQNR